ncbi:MAG: hypothetical protein FWF75_00200 [Propionibacteriaceae bacterium]|nr:hypothetical protein [Propionibacteriaceae bacterium]
MSGLLNILAPLDVVLRAMRDMPGCEIRGQGEGPYQAWFDDERTALFYDINPEVAAPNPQALAAGTDFAITDSSGTIDAQIYDYLAKAVGAPMFLNNAAFERIRTTSDYPEGF